MLIFQTACRRLHPPSGPTPLHPPRPLALSLSPMSPPPLPTSLDMLSRVSAGVFVPPPSLLDNARTHTCYPVMLSVCTRLHKEMRHALRVGRQMR